MMVSVARLSSVFRKDLFSGKVAIVTGGGTGIGKAITEELVELGCKVVIASRTLEKVETAAKEINETRKVDSVYPYQCNIRNEDQVSGI